MPQDSKKNKIGFQIHTISKLIRQDIERTKKLFPGDEITFIHGWVLGYLYDNRKNDVFQKDFENAFSIRRSTASNILSLMEKNGLINRVSVPYDARLKKIVLTDKALYYHDIIKKDIYAREKRIKNGLTEEEINTFFKITEKIKNNLMGENT